MRNLCITKTGVALLCVCWLGLCLEAATGHTTAPGTISIAVAPPKNVTIPAVQDQAIVPVNPIPSLRNERQQAQLSSTAEGNVLRPSDTLKPPLGPTANKIGQLEPVTMAQRLLWSIVLVGQLVVIVGVLGLFFSYYRRGLA